jgi:hypothetical protein
MPESEVYRDADTLGRLLTMIDADRCSLDAIESIKADALAAMAGTGTPTSEGNTGVAAQTGGQPADPGPVPLFKVGDLVPAEIAGKFVNGAAITRDSALGGVIIARDGRRPASER